MNQHLQKILDLIQKSESIDSSEKEQIRQAIKKVDDELVITSFKLDRTEKVKRTTSILLEETIEELEKKREDVVQTNEALKKSLEDLKAAQAQLIHSEKMASLGELTAGIAHEIQNPLNFVNNFSEVSADLIEEMNEEIALNNHEEVTEIANDLKQNLEKISHHGKRASGIVKGMLEHSRTGDQEKESTDLNVMVDEYLRLAYHGLRAKDKSFNAEFKIELDSNLPKIEVIPQDIGRVLLNLINNAFYASSSKVSHPTPKAIDDKEATEDSNFKPLVTVSTKKLEDKIEIRVSDNGPGIPEEIKDKIFQPFFTTKPTGSGTGLGLSLSYDIVKAHGGEINADSELGKGTSFAIKLPIV